MSGAACRANGISYVWVRSIRVSGTAWLEESPGQIENDIPQPQVVVAFGLLITKRDPCRSSL